MASIRPKVVLQEAKTLEQKGAIKEAARKYASLIGPLVKRGKASEALIIIDKILVLSPASTRLYLTRALCLKEVKRDREAIEEIEKFATAALRQNRVTQYWELINEKAAKYPRLHQTFLEKILSVERTRADLFFHLSEALSRLGDTIRAFQMVFSGLTIAPNDELGMKFLKKLISEKGQKSHYLLFEKFIKGEVSIEKIKKQILDDERISQASSKKSEVDSLNSENSLLKSLDEENISTLKNLIQELEEELGDRPDGIETISGLITEFKQKALSVLKDDPNTLFDLAVAFREMGLLNESKEVISKIDNSHMKFDDAQSLLGGIEFESGSFVASLEIFQLLLRKESLDLECKKDALYHVVRIYIQLQDFKKASDFADKLTKIDSNYRNLTRLRIELNGRLNNS